MIITVKILKGNEGKDCRIEVNTNSSISFIKQLVARELDVPVDQQLLVFKGRALSDSMSLADYNIIDGTKLHLLIRKTDTMSDKIENETTILWSEVEKVLLKHFSRHHANNVLEQFKKELSQTMAHWNLDDIERLANFYMHDNPSSTDYM